MAGSIPGLSQWVKDLTVAVAVVQAGGYSSNWTPSLGTSICCGCDPKKESEREREKERNEGKSRKAAWWW